MTSIISPQVRAKIYVVYAITGLLIGSVQVGFAAADAGQPVALTVALAVYAFLGGALGYVAQQNTPVNGQRRAKAPESPVRSESEQD